MQIKIKISSNSNIILPVHYNNILQGFIYKNIDEDLANFLHDGGYIVNGRNFKLFTFSRVLTKGKIEGKNFNFGKEIELMIGSPLEIFCKSIVNHMLINDNLFLGKNNIKVNNLEIIDTKIDKEEIIVATLSGIVTYSTMTSQDGRKYTNYFKSYNSDFERIVKENILKKYQALYNSELENAKFEIELIGEEKQSTVYYKKTIIKGVSGRYKLKGSKELLGLGLSAGIGNKNSQGFGMIRKL